MKYKSIAMIIIAFFVIGIGTSMTMNTDSETIDCYPGETVSKDYSYTYDNGFFFGSPNDVKIVASSKSTESNQQLNDYQETIFKESMSDGETIDKTFKYTVPEDIEPGQYTIEVVSYCSSSNDWTEGGTFEVNLNVHESDDSSDESDDSGDSDSNQDTKAAYFNINVEPEGSSVYLNDEFVGKTPLEYADEPGEYTVKIDHPSYKEYTTDVTLTDTDTFDLDGELNSRDPVHLGGSTNPVISFIQGFFTWLFDFVGVDA